MILIGAGVGAKRRPFVRAAEQNGALRRAIFYRAIDLSRLVVVWAVIFAAIAAIAANLLLALSLFRRAKNFWLSLAAGLILAGTLAIFFTWTYPANQATKNWTIVAANWQQLRAQWEFSHAADAVLTFIALCCATASSARATAASKP